MDQDDLIDINRKNWDNRVEIHKQDTIYYNIAAFKQGELAFKADEHLDLQATVGSLKGKTLLHLQCHFGLDTMSFSRLGAIATGVDFSAEAIKLANTLRDEVNMDTRFLCSDVYKLPEILDETFDIIATSVGVIGWLPDLVPWAKVIANHLKSGGIFYLKDSHPITNIFTAVDGELHLVSPYFKTDPNMYDDGMTYAGDRLVDTHPTNYQWNHTLSDILHSLSSAGLHLTHFQEYPYTFYERYSKADMSQNDRGYWQLSGSDHKKLPLSFMLMVTKV